MKVPQTLQERRRGTEQRLKALRSELAAVGAPGIVENRACVYATGSVGRGEMFSDSAFKRERFAEAREFGNNVFTLVLQLGSGTDLLRYLVV